MLYQGIKHDLIYMMIYDYDMIYEQNHTQHSVIYISVINIVQFFI